MCTFVHKINLSLIQRNIYPAFLEKFVAKAKQLRVGDPLDELTFCGAVNSKVHYEKVMSYIKLAVTDGATIHCGQMTRNSKGRLAGYS